MRPPVLRQRDFLKAVRAHIDAARPSNAVSPLPGTRLSKNRLVPKRSHRPESKHLLGQAHGRRLSIYPAYEQAIAPLILYEGDS